jgi:hypothetical protein
MQDLKSGQTRRPIHSKLDIPGIGWVTGDVELGADGWLFRVKEKGAPKQHVSNLEAGLAEWLKVAAGAGTSMTLDFTGLDHLRLHAEAAWLRAAYLAAFAQFGTG